MFVTKEKSVYMQYLHQDKGLSGNQILGRFPQYSKATICWHMKKPIDHNVFDRHVNTQVDQRNLQNWMKETLYVQCTAWEFPLGPSLQRDLELRLVFSPQLPWGLNAEDLIHMAISIYNHAETACWHAKILTRD